MMIGASNSATFWKWNVFENTSMNTPIESETVVIVIAEPALSSE